MTITSRTLLGVCWEDTFVGVCWEDTFVFVDILVQYYHLDVVALVQ